MEFSGIDVNEMEKQRYKYIKNTGKYIEMNILISAENETYQGQSAKSPVVTMNMCHCGPAEIACMYSTLKTLATSLKKQYPMECLMSELGAVEVQDMGTVQCTPDEEA